MLTSAGYWNGVATGTFGPGLYRAIAAFQADNGLPADGSLTEETVRKLINAAAPSLNLWGFTEARHPTRPVSLWIPTGLGLTAERSQEGLLFQDPRDRVMISLFHYPNRTVEESHRIALASAERVQGTVKFSTLKRSFQVVSYTSAQGFEGFVRYHKDGRGVTGFTITWIPANGSVSADRIAVLMSGSLAASVAKAPYLGPFTLRGARDTEQPPYRPSQPPQQRAQAEPPPAPPPPAPEKQPKPRVASSGTGFFINGTGYMLTNAHVVKQCEHPTITPSIGETVAARLIAVDAANDLALLKADVKPDVTALIRTHVRLGEPIAVFGYPLTTVLSRNGNFTLGNITALAGLGDDSNHLQISAPVQPGNSGGPLLDQHGNLVGVIQSKLNALRMAASSGDVPQNVNFAIKASVAVNFLTSNGISFTESSPPAQAPLDSVALAEKAKSISAFILCK